MALEREKFEIEQKRIELERFRLQKEEAERAERKRIREHLAEVEAKRKKHEEETVWPSTVTRSGRWVCCMLARGILIECNCRLL